MKLSKRGEYGLKALIDLASQEDPRTMAQIKDIARRQQIPVKFLEQIMLAMKNGGILHSRAGVGGAVRGHPPAGRARAFASARRDGRGDGSPRDRAPVLHLEAGSREAGILDGIRLLGDRLDSLRIPYSDTTFVGGHVDRVRERFTQQMLPAVGAGSS